MQRGIIALLLGLCSTVAASAGQSMSPAFDESFSFRLGAYFVSTEGNLGSSRDDISTPDLDLDALGLDDDYTSPYFRARWRPTDRWRLSFSYFKFDDDGDEIDYFDFEFEDIDVSGFVRVESKLKTDFYVVQAGYSLLKNERYELGLGAGLHVVDLETKIDVSGQLNDLAGQVTSASLDVTAPLPNVMLYAAYAFTPKLYLEGALAYFSLSYDKYSGHLDTAMVNLEYRFTENFGAGIGYNYAKMNLDIDHKNRTDTYDLKYTGPLVFVSAGF